MNPMIKKSIYDAEQRQTLVAQTLAEMVQDGSAINYTTVATRCGVSRNYLYRHPEFSSIINAHRLTGMSKEDLRREVVKLRLSLHAYEKHQEE